MTTKIFHSNMAGAPVLSGTAGAMIAILDACLKDGFGLVTMDSLTVSGGVATLSRSGGMTFEADAVVQLAGITGTYSSLNGDRRLLSVGASTATFDATGLPNGTAAGTITAKVSPLGWSKPFSGTNLAAYKATDPTALGMYLRVDDSGTTAARVVGYESMSDINTGTGLFPTASQQSGGGYWEKSGAAGSTARNWIVVGDERTFYWWSVPNGTTAVTSQGVLRGFGDLIPRRSADAYAAFLGADVASVVTSGSAIIDLASASGNPAGYYLSLPRSQSALGASVLAWIYAESKRATTTQYKSGSPSGISLPYPNSSDNALDLDRALVLEGSDYSIRGQFPGLYHLPQAVGFAFSTWDKVSGQGSLNGRKLLAVRVGSPGQVSQNAAGGSPGVVMFDITGPWR